MKDTYWSQRCVKFVNGTLIRPAEVYGIGIIGCISEKGNYAISVSLLQRLIPPLYKYQTLSLPGREVFPLYSTVHLEETSPRQLQQPYSCT